MASRHTPVADRSSKSPRVALISLGCPKNQVDSELILSGFLDAGFETIETAEQADVVIVNTCGFIGPAKEESVDTILEVLEAKRSHPSMRVLVSGCLYQRYPAMKEELAAVDYWLDRPEQAPLGRVVRQVQADLGVWATRGGRRVPTARKLLLSEPGSAYLRIAEGCGRRCGFCAIPRIKGALVSETIDRVVADARWLSDRFGVREINLVAQDLASFGSDRGPNEMFDLLRALDDQTDVRWFRLLYVYPLSLNRAVLEFIGSSRRFAHYLDVPFQHADSDVLEAMRRGGGSLVAYLRHVRSIRRAIPGVALRTTLLVGHPGETVRRFETLLEFIREAHFEWMGVFPYSREEDTHSARLSGRVPAPVSERRAVEAMDAFREARSLDSFRLGEVRDALVVEDASDGFLACRTETEAPEIDGQLFVPVKPGVRPGQVVRVRVDEAMDMDFKGELVGRGVGHGTIRTTVMGGVTVVPERRARQR